MFATKNIPSTSDFSIDTKRNRLVWFFLSFQAGWINAGGFLACHRFVSHVTGFATQFGIDVAEVRWADAFGMLTVPLFFLAGTMISAYYVDRRLNHGEQGQFHILFFLMSFFLLLVTVFGTLGFFGHFGAALDIMSDYVLIALLCLSSGIQNAGITTASNSFVRTTHLTGMTTDLGIGIVRVMTQDQKQIKSIERHKNEVRTLLIVSFIIGSVMASFLFLKIAYLGFAIPTMISFGLYVLAKKGIHTNA